MGVFKPIACRIFPQINPLPNLGMISQEPSTQCPRQKFIGNNFEIKTAQAKLKLSPFLLPVKSIIEIASCVPRDKEDLNILVSALSPRATMLN
jgi:hypothetical protein